MFQLPTMYKNLDNVSVNMEKRHINHESRDFGSMYTSQIRKNIVDLKIIQSSELTKAVVGIDLLNTCGFNY